MKDPAHHRKFIQKKVIKEARQVSEENLRESSSQIMTEERESSPLNPEYEGERFDPHHRKPRLLKRINFH